ncbi:hypothetical protein [Allosalinactinospora lopnorensis]|uniref:hypothetical protein n=1 Tax=Allosalinactinospora lopnorensis TaxID=1352348 RepID=UPI000623DFB1|nr:hypothetical protein [Allosalinactinospora lopnorensis]
MRLLMVFVPLIALLYRLTEAASPPLGRHADNKPEPDPRPAPPPPEPPDRPRRTARTRPYVPVSEEEGTAFYELAEFSRYASLWDFSYDALASFTRYSATHRVQPEVSLGASSPQALEQVLNDIELPSWPRRYAHSGRDHRAAAEEQAGLDRLMGATR